MTYTSNRYTHQTPAPIVQLSGFTDIAAMADKLLSDCRKLGLSPTEIEQCSGISFRTIQYWRKGRDPKLSSLIFFAEMLGYKIQLVKDDEHSFANLNRINRGQ